MSMDVSMNSFSQKTMQSTTLSKNNDHTFSTLMSINDPMRKSSTLMRFPTFDSTTSEVLKCNIQKRSPNYKKCMFISQSTKDLLPKLSLDSPKTENSFTSKLSNMTLKSNFPSQVKIHYAMDRVITEEEETVKGLDKWAAENNIDELNGLKTPTNAALQANEILFNSYHAIRKSSIQNDLLKSPVKQLDSLAKRKRARASVPILNDFKLPTIEQKPSQEQLIKLVATGPRRRSCVDSNTIMARKSLPELKKMSSKNLLTAGDQRLSKKKDTLNPSFITELLAMKHACEKEGKVLKSLGEAEGAKLREVSSNKEIQLAIKAQELKDEIDNNKKYQEQYRVLNHRVSQQLMQLTDESRRIKAEIEKITNDEKDNSKTAAFNMSNMRFFKGGEVGIREIPPSSRRNGKAQRYPTMGPGNQSLGLSAPTLSELQTKKNDLTLKLNNLLKDSQALKEKFNDNAHIGKSLDKKCKLVKSELRKIEKEQSNYYHTLLFLGLEARDEGLVWIIKSIGYLNEDADVSKMPRFLDTEAVQFLINLSQKDGMMAEALKKSEAYKKERRNLSQTSLLANESIDNPKSLAFNQKDIHLKADMLLSNIKNTSTTDLPTESTLNKFFMEFNEHAHKKREEADDIVEFRRMDSEHKAVEFLKQANDLKAEMKQLKEKELARICGEFISNNYEKRFNVAPDVVLSALFGENTMKREISKLMKKIENKHTVKEKLILRPSVF